MKALRQTDGAVLNEYSGEDRLDVRIPGKVVLLYKFFKKLLIMN